MAYQSNLQDAITDKNKPLNLTLSPHHSNSDSIHAIQSANSDGSDSFPAKSPKKVETSKLPSLASTLSSHAVSHFLSQSKPSHNIKFPKTPTQIIVTRQRQSTTFHYQLLNPSKMTMAKTKTTTTTTATATVQSDQLQQLRCIFDRFDMDRDGSLTHLELAALLRSLGLKPSGDQIHVLLANIDSDGNGTVEFDELVAAILPDINEQVLINQDQLMEVFRSFDRDGNGYITAAELAGQMAKMGHPLTYRELSEMMQEADTNGDGVISFNEFANVMGRSAVDYLGLAVVPAAS